MATNTTYVVSITIRKGSNTAINLANQTISLEQSVEVEPVVIPVGTTWYQLPFSTIASGEFAFLETNQDILLRINDHTDTVFVSDWWLLRGGITAAYVKNISSTPAVVTFLLGKEASS